MSRKRASWRCCRAWKAAHVITLSLLCWSFSLTALADEHRYQGVCDASAAAVIDDSHIIVGNDEDEILSLYNTDGSTMAAIQNFNFTSDLRRDPDREIDIEDAARLGDRIYWIASHSRSKKGKRRTNRHRLFATDIAGALPRLQLKWGGHYDHLVQDLLDRQNWDDDSSVITGETIDLIAQSTQMDKKKVGKLKPKKMGLSIEALAVVPGQGGLLIGLRNPLLRGKALVLHVKNPDALLAHNGEKARFSAPFYIDLGGLGLRSMSYDPTGKVFLIIAGPNKNGGPFKLYKWDGTHDHSPVFLRKLKHGKGSYPEALLIHERKIQVLNDEGRRRISKRRCKTVSKEQRSFSAQWYYLDSAMSMLPK